jgi:hypothetical protein
MRRCWSGCEPRRRRALICLRLHLDCPGSLSMRHRRTPPSRAFSLSPRYVSGGNVVILRELPASEHNILNLQRILQLRDDFKQILDPLLLSPVFQSSDPQVLLESLSMFVWQMGEFQGLKYAINNQSRSQPCAQAEKKHTTAAVAAKGLQRSIVDDPDGTSKGFLKIEADPTWSKIDRIAEGLQPGCRVPASICAWSGRRSRLKSQCRTDQASRIHSAEMPDLPCPLLLCFLWPPTRTSTV